MIKICEREYYVKKLLGYGKGGYSFLADASGGQAVIKQIHHEPCDYYTFGNKIEAEKHDYERLQAAGIRVPKMLAIDEKTERIVKEYIEGDTIFDLVERGENVDMYIGQVREMAVMAKAAYLNIDYFPTNFVVRDGVIWYIDYECNDYMEEWNFENWGIKYWSRTPEFLDYVGKHRSNKKSGKDIALIMVQTDGYAYDHLSEELQRDRDVITAALHTSPDMLEQLPDDLREDDEYILLALETIANGVPDPEDHTFFDDGTSRYYSEFEVAEDDFCDVVRSISKEHLEDDPELVGKICELALKIDDAHYDEGNDPYEWMHKRLPCKLKETFDDMGILKDPLPKEAIAKGSSAAINESRFEGMTSEERLLHLSADRYDWYAGKGIARYGAESWRDYMAPGGNYVRFCMIDFTKKLINYWPGLYHEDARWGEGENKVDLDRVYEEISKRLSPKMKVEREASGYYYSENVSAAVNENILFKLVRGCPLNILELWVNKVDSEHEHGFRVAPDRLGVFCEMAEYLFDNYDRFAEMAESRAARLREKYGL